MITIPTPEPVEGWLAISNRIARRTGLDVTVDAAQRWSRRADDPLPVARFGSKRPRIVAEASAIDAWCDRQWVKGAG